MRREASPWTAELRHRWQRIEAHALGGLESGFVARLAREQVWSTARAQRAVLEYRRFVLLAVAAGHRVSPSHAVDTVWHLHLLFTRDYWSDFCPRALGMPLHHDPEVQPQDAEVNRADYARTVESYRRFFGAPAQLWWPAPAQQPDGARSRVSTRPAARISRLQPGLITRWRRLLALPVSGALLLLPTPVLAARGLNPLEWSGGDFLGLYLGLMLLVGVGSLMLRRVLRRRVTAPNLIPGELDNYEAALLVGGPQRVIDTAVVELHQRGVLHWDKTRQRFERSPSSQQLDPLLASIAGTMGGDVPLRRAWSGAAHAIGPIQARLVKRGLWLDAGSAGRIAWLAALPSIALLGLGITKIGIGLAREKPVGILVVLGVLTAVYVLIMALSRPGRSRAGDQEAARLRVTHRVRQKRHGRGKGSTERDSDLVFAVAIGGTALLTGTSLIGYHEARAASGSSSSDSSTGGDSDSGGGGGCGGCGGGGD